MLRAALTVSLFLALFPLPTGAQVATPDSTAAASPVEFVWESSGGPDLYLATVTFLTVDPDGNLWTADGGNSRFQIFSPDGAFREAWGTPGTGDGQFNFVTALGVGLGAAAFDRVPPRRGNLYVVDTGNARVQRFDHDRRFVAALGGRGIGDGQFLNPIGIAVGPDGRVYVIDDHRDDVQVFAADGTFLFKFGGPGVGDGQIGDAGSGIAVAPDGTILVADYGNHRIQRFGPNGEFLAAWGEAGRGEGQFSSPDGLAVDGQGRVFVADYGNARVQVFDREGRFLTEWSEFGGTAGELLAPMSIAADGHGQVYVGFYGRVQAFQLRPPLAPGSDS